jgi:hypothetical protein
MVLPSLAMVREASSPGALGAFVLTAALTFGLAGASMTAESAASDEGRPVVVELYTSQGCSSCPPADALLAELATEPGVLALSFHVDYWDYIGWKDPFAAAEHTQRQRDYVAELGLRYVYTPQMVIDGRHDAVGSNRRAVTEAIEKAAATTPVVDVTLEAAGGGRALLSAGTPPTEEEATVWLVTFDDGHDTEVARGENLGRALHNSNVVRTLTALGTWSGEAKSFSLDFSKAKAEGRGGCAVIVQQGPGGPVLGAAAYDLDSYTN